MARGPSPFRRASLAVLLACGGAPGTGLGQDPAVASLPEGVRAVWGLGSATREATVTRERLCLNGLWRWQPASPSAETLPKGRWGFFKVPGCWPGITDYMQKDCQTVFAHPAWKGEALSRVSAAWYQREIEVPAGWAGRRVSLRAEYVNSFAVAYVDAARTGEIRFPGGSCDVTPALRPGARHVLSLLVVALPLKAVRLSFSDSASAREVRGRVERRGLCGDVWLESAPAGPRIAGVAIATSVRLGEISVRAELEGLADRAALVLRARVGDRGRTVKEFVSAAFTGADLEEGRFEFTAAWKPDRLWDLHTPDHVYTLDIGLETADGAALDAAWPERFGFRELWIEGRDIHLNGSRLFLSVVPLDNAQVGAGLASEAAARETFSRLKGAGVSAVYTHHYGCEPGSHLDVSGILRAADDSGVLVLLSQPHFGAYDWGGPEADANNGFARDAEYFVRVAGNHPSVVLYAMSHNGAGYAEDMNPDQLGTGSAARDEWSRRNSLRALRAEAIVRRLDPSRIVYHHSAGDLGSMHTVNFYANFVPIQEMSDWLATWATRGVKPLFLCEYGVPVSWDWTMYRGWYEGRREFGSAAVPWEFCHAEWNAQFLGDRAFSLGEPERRNLRWEAKQFREGKLWHRWDYPVPVGSNRLDDRAEVIGEYLSENLRALRAWGLSACCVWDHGSFWRVRDGVDRSRRALPVDWDRLQRPGFSADFVGEQYESFECAFEPGDWTPTAAGRALLRNNGPRLGFIGGGPDRFTAKDHLFRPGETVAKQLVVINNSRAPEACACSWSLDFPEPIAGARELRIGTGEIARVPLSFALPSGLAPRAYTLAATFRFGNGKVQEDRFTIHVLAPEPRPPPAARIAIFDPGGETARLLAGLGIAGDPVGPGADLGGYDLLVVGRNALTVDGPAPDIGRVRDGLRVVVFEQPAAVLERRLGFRATEYGLRRVFPRLPGSPLLDGLDEAALQDWRGEATLLPPRLAYEMRPMHGPTVSWSGLPVTRAWRCGCRGSVASVLVEKPARGDSLPVLDGGFSEQYAPLLLYREDRGLVLFCQADVTGRTTADPGAERLVRNVVSFSLATTPVPRRRVVYAGEPAGLSFLASAGHAPEPYRGGPPPRDSVLVAGPGGGAALAAHRADVGAWVEAGGAVLALGLEGKELSAFLPAPVATSTREHIAAVFDPEAPDSPLAGVGPADVHDRSARRIPLVTGGAQAVGDGVLAVANGGRVVLCQLVPWHFGDPANKGLRRTFRRSAFLVNRLLANLGAAGSTPLLVRFRTPATADERRWLDGFYLDAPEEWDDPYRFFRW
ncbi:MAG: hypothetical protein L0216_19585 [Planctomycetales bacterium]|nr:hypothetical protein [Planctomycetales bacterium]